MNNHGSDWDHRTSFKDLNPYWQRRQGSAAVRYAKEGQIGLSRPIVRITSIHFGFDGFDDESADLVWSRPTSAGSGRPQGYRLERLVEFRVHTLEEFLVSVWIAATFDKCIDHAEHGGCSLRTIRSQVDRCPEEGKVDRRRRVAHGVRIAQNYRCVGWKQLDRSNEVSCMQMRHCQAERASG